MAKEKSIIRVESAALDDFEGNIILRGVISNDCLGHLLVDTYQREELTVAQRAGILEALNKGEPLPDLELGMRGQKFTDAGNGVVLLHDPVYIIDGQQRRQSILSYLAEKPDARVRIGIKVFFGTTVEWERDRFEALNMKRAKVAPGVLLRNRCETSRGIRLAWEITTSERTFVMFNRVCWKQNYCTGELITAGMFVQVATGLHAHKSPVGNTSVASQTQAMDRTLDSIGIQNMRENLRTFWGLIDECWGIQKIHFRGKATYMKGTFLFVLARVLSDHHDFWETGPDEKKLFIHAPIRRKLAQFPIDDPEVVRLAGSGGKARNLLYLLLRDHINKGKTTKKLRSRMGGSVFLDDSEELEAAA